jgi:hypothetical protein
MFQNVQERYENVFRFEVLARKTQCQGVELPVACTVLTGTWRVYRRVAVGNRAVRGYIKTSQAM